MRRTVAVAVAALVLSLAFAAPAVAATRVSGYVKSISKKTPIKGAVITSGKYKAKSNKRGFYSIKVSPGRPTLKVSAKGYLTTYQVTAARRNKITRVNWALTRGYPRNKVPARAVTVLAWNDLGMHCDQDSYRYFMVLPPFNTIRAQVFADGDLKTKYTVSYAFARKSNSTLHTDFWTYAPSFGYSLAPNVGLTGNGMTGTMKKDSRGLGYIAEGIPVTPYNDDGTWDPYGKATLTVRDSHGTVVATQDVVVPVSTEMSCNTCHGSSPEVDILTRHDDSNGTSLLADAESGHPHACSECHADNALGAAGRSSLPSLSLAMHRKHDGKIANTTAGCYTCHPGPKTQCQRGIMARAGKTCVSCHGTMTSVWQSAANGRRPWLDEPKCGTCHGSKYAENSGTLFRDSVLKNTHEDMGGKIYCEACHNSTHAEYVSARADDAVVPKSVQGNSYWIYNCQVCHKGGGDDDDDDDVAFKGQRMHR
jgi:hypothetical protein